MYEGFVVVNGVANFEICARCGQAIKNVYWWHGKPYGSECINVVTGQKADYWIVKNGVIDEQATIEREQARVKANDERAKKQAEIERNWLVIEQENKWLIDVLITQYGQFCADMAQSLKTSRLTDFSNKQISFMADIYAKYSGRRNSKAYNEAYDFFYDKLDNTK